MHEYIYSAVSLVNPPLLPFLLYSIPLLHESTTPFTYLDISFLVIVVRMSIHPSSLVNSRLFTPCCLTHPEDNHGSGYMFT
jgi:hypothetical protein